MPNQFYLLLHLLLHIHFLRLGAEVVEVGSCHQKEEAQVDRTQRAVGVVLEVGVVPAEQAGQPVVQVELQEDQVSFSPVAPSPAVPVSAAPI